jgi:glycosyltransferase involved in cell wall biosynthesis
MDNHIEKQRFPSVTNVGLGLHKSSGGTAQAVEDFSEALKARTIAFANINRFKQEGFFSEHTIPALFPGRGLRSAYSWPHSNELSSANNIAKDTDMFCCHILYRYHVQWVREQIRKRPRPYWVVPHGCLDPFTYHTRFLLKWFWMNPLGKSFIREASLVIFATHQERKKAAHWCRPEQAQVVYWPIEKNNIPSTTTLNTWRDRLNIPLKDRILLFLGRLHDVKRPLETIDAFAKSGVENVHLVIAGPEENVTIEQCKKRSKQLNIKNVHMVGPVYGAEKKSLFEESDGFISFSKKENFGYVTAEALYAGKPVILSPGNDLGPEIKEEDCAWILAEDSEACAISAIKSFALSSSDQLHAMGERGKRWCLNNLSFDVFEKQLITLSQDTVRQFKN